MFRPKELYGCSRKYIAGIYQIKNLINGKVYIGSSNHLYRRYSDHLRDLQRGAHSNPRLQASWNKYGKDSFEFSVLEYCFPEYLFTLEQKYIDSLNPELNIEKEVGTLNTPKAGTHDAMQRYLKIRDSIQRNGTFESEEYRKQRSKISKDIWLRDGFKELRSTETKNLWSDARYKEKQRCAHRKVNSLEREYVRKLHSMGVKLSSIASQFKVSYGTIRRIVLGLH